MIGQIKSSQLMELKMHAQRIVEIIEDFEKVDKPKKEEKSPSEGFEKLFGDEGMKAFIERFGVPLTGTHFNTLADGLGEILRQAAEEKRKSRDE